MIKNLNKVREVLARFSYLTGILIRLEVLLEKRLGSETGKQLGVGMDVADVSVVQPELTIADVPH